MSFSRKVFQSFWDCGYKPRPYAPPGNSLNKENQLGYC